MPTLNAMFHMMDGWNSQLVHFLNSVDQAASEVLKAGRATDRFNDSLDENGKASGRASKGLKAFKDAADFIDKAKKVMDLTDSYTHTATQLAQVNDGMQKQAQLQEKVFAAAERSRGSYEDLAGAVAKMSMLAGDSFSSNDEAIGFAELLSKSMKISGTSAPEQQAVSAQLGQAMGEGKLDGNGFGAILENAPVVARAIADYMNTPIEKMEELSSQGLITSDVIKNAMFSASGEINRKFDSIPATFADVWTQFQNDGQRAFGGVFEKINGILNSEETQGVLSNLIGLMYLFGEATENFIDFCVTAWPIVSPFIWAAAAALGAYLLVQGISNALSMIAVIWSGVQTVGMGLLAAAMWVTGKATWSQVTAQLGLNTALYACPLVWVIGLIVLLVAAIYAGVAAFNSMAGTSYSATGVICGAFMFLVAVVYNAFTGISNFIIGFGVEIINLFITITNFFANMFRDPIGSIYKLIFDLVDFIVGVGQSVAKILDTIFGSNLAGSIEGFRNKVSAMGEELAGPQVEVVEKLDASDYQLDRMEYGASFDSGYQTGKGFDDKVSNLFSGFKDGNVFEDILGSGGQNENGYDGMPNPDDDLGTKTNPAVFEGTGSKGEVEVNMADEDVQFLKDLAQRDYIARIASNTLAPNIRVEFTGKINRDIDLDTLGSRVGAILKDELERAPEGVY